MNKLLNKLQILNAVLEYSRSNPVRYHMPGHKGEDEILTQLWNSLLKIDVTEIPDMDNLYHPRGFLADAMNRCAKIFGSIKTLFLVNGSTAGIQAALEATVGDKKEVILSRDCHKAVYNKVIMSGYTPYYIKVGFDRDVLTPALPSADDVVEVMDRTGCKTVIMTSPNYYGMVCDVGRIADEVHKRDGILIIDEAHGAHYTFSSALPDSAIRCGADIVIQSAHKTLPVINQGAYLHVCSRRVDPDQINMALSMIQTSSPSYIIMALLEYAAVHLHECGDILYNKLCEDIRLLQQRCDGDGDIHIKSGLCKNAVDKDVTRILIDAHRAGYTGFELEQRLRSQYNIAVEAADLYGCSLIATVSDPVRYINTLVEALKNGVKTVRNKQPADIRELPLPEMILLPKEAIRREKQTVEIESGIGRIAGKAVIPYPPGIPLIVPGERITSEAVSYIRSVLNEGGFIEGLEDMNGNSSMDVVK